MAQPTRMERFMVLAITTIPLIGHILFTFGALAFLLVFVQNRPFNTDSTGTRGWRAIVQQTPVWDPTKNAFSYRIKLSNHIHLLQSDVTTILSALLVISRFFLGWWCTGVVWKSVFILLEQAGLTVRQISRVVSWGFLLPTTDTVAATRPWSNRVRGYVIIAALLLPFPAQLSSPIITGSITWKPAYELNNGSSIAVPTPANCPAWSEYQGSRDYRHAVVTDAARTSTLGWKNVTTPLAYDIFKRELNGVVELNIQPNSVIYQIKAPYLKFDNFRWVTNLMAAPGLDPQVVEGGSAWLNVSFMSSPPLSYPGQRSVSLIMPMPWREETLTGQLFDDANTTSYQDQDEVNPAVYTFPSPVIFNETVYIAVFADEMKSNGSGNVGLPITPDWYGVNDPNDSGTETENNRHCFIFGAVDVLAGVAMYGSCPIESDRFASCNITEAEQVLPDPMVREALWLIPEVVSSTLLMDEDAVSLFFSSVDLGGGPSKNQLETYVKAMLSRSYSAAWGSLADYMDVVNYMVAGAQRDQSGNISVALSMVEGIVDRPRVYVWFILQVLVWFAALLFWTVQSHCRRPVSGETIVAAMFMDTSKVYDPRDSHGAGLGDAVTLNSEHDRLGVLRLECSNGHSQLVRDHDRIGDEKNV